MQRSDELALEGTKGGERSESFEANPLAEERVEPLRRAPHAALREDPAQGGLGVDLTLGVRGALRRRALSEEGPEHLGINQHPGFDLAHGDARSHVERPLGAPGPRGLDSGLDDARSRGERGDRRIERC